MPNYCRCCKTDRAAEDKEPRARIPVFIPGRAAMYLCPYCDGDALAKAKEVEKTRLAGG